jgi:hypothetical protein
MVFQNTPPPLVRKFECVGITLGERLVLECGVHLKFQQNISYFRVGYCRFILFALFLFRPGKL